MTFGFLFVILGATHGNAPQGFAPIAIGLCLTLIHLISIPVTNTSVNPARSTGPALFAGGWALEQLWLFWVAPLIGAAFAGVVYRVVGGEEPAPVEVAGNAQKACIGILFLPRARGEVPRRGGGVMISSTVHDPSVA